MKKVLYHANCNDGSAAAMIADRYFKGPHVEGGPVDFIPVQYGESPPDGLDGKDVYILDFSYKRDVLLDLAERALTVVVLDHHKTAQEDLSNHMPENVFVLFDMKKSGAMLAWEYFFPGAPVPILIQHVQDRDLWKKQMEGTDEIALALGLYPDWRDWSVYLDDCRPLIEQGKTLMRFKRQMIKRILAIKPDVCIPFFGSNRKVPVFNVQGFLISDLLHEALAVYGDAEFAVAYFDLPDKRVYSLRSRTGSDVDVSAIAKKFGGGGHRHAAGFSLQHHPFSRAPNLLGIPGDDVAVAGI